MPVAKPATRRSRGTRPRRRRCRARRASAEPSQQSRWTRPPRPRRARRDTRLTNVKKASSGRRLSHVPAPTPRPSPLLAPKAWARRPKNAVARRQASQRSRPTCTFADQPGRALKTLFKEKYGEEHPAP